MENFEKKYKQIAGTELWHLFVRLAGEINRELVSAVGEVCAIGLNLSKDIIRFFPTFTLHDDVHSANVCRWIYILLGDRAEELTVSEAALLLMAACCHDIGMSVTDGQKREMTDRGYPGWDDYFRRNLDDDEEFCRTGVISDRMLRNFVRLHHHERIGENLRQSDWPEILTRGGIRREMLLTLCRSHGTSLCRSELRSQRNKCDMLLCAVLLRLADLLDYDTSRSPAVLFRHTGLDQPQTAEKARSAAEYKKNQAGIFEEYIEDGVLRYNAVYDNLQLEHDVQQYLDWVERELNQCADDLAQTGSHWQDLRLPYKISTEGVERRGYASGKFCMTMDQDKVVELLAGKHLYSDPGVFVRELLQNSIDAVLMRVRQEPGFTAEQGRIIIDTWPDDTGDTWFRIRDNGIGMDEHIITNYFLKVGRSYYTSDEFRAANRHAPGGKAYTAISRFGIGILSCFMNDPERTELKVSTKRFRSQGQNGIRLDVTGLHGYYYLAREEEHPVYEESFLRMPTPGDGEWGYRREPGTTICVRTNLFRLGSTQSFREILDKYVQFPEIQVEYHGPEGDKVYPTQQELMDAVHALNPDGVVKEYVHEIPEEWYAEVQEKYPMAQWEKKPALVIRYYPLDWLSDSENLTGAVIEAEVQESLSDREQVMLDETGREERFILMSDWDLTFSETNQLLCRVAGVKASTTKKFLVHPLREVVFDRENLDCMPLLTEQEQRAIALLWSAVYSAGKYNFVSYHGILADSQEETYRMDSFRSTTVLLLRGTFQPEVSVARDSITDLPAEVVCCLRMAALECTGLYTSWDPAASSVQFITARELRGILDRHPVWRERLMPGKFLRAENRRIFFDEEKHQKYVGKLDCRRDLLEVLYLAAWAGIKTPRRDFCDEIRLCRMVDAPEDEAVLDFPAGLFQLPEAEHSPFADIEDTNVYNRTHPFSLWLIGNREQLVEQVPAMYDTLIRTMVLGDDKKTIRETLNTILTRLRSFDGNCFGIHDGLFLTEDDFV